MTPNTVGSSPLPAGDERRQELLRRLVAALRRSDLREEAAESPPRKGLEASAGENRSAAVANPTQRPTEEPAPSSSEVLEQRLRVLLEEHRLDPLPERLRSCSKADLRRELKRIQNLRATEFASRVSGPGQDSRLRENARLVTKIGTEQARLRELRRTSRYGSSMLVNGGTVMAIDEQLGVLEQLKDEVKTRVKQLRQRIREECDGHPEFGLLAEERISAAVDRAPDVRPVSKGRLRRRVEELKRPVSERESGRGFLLDGQDLGDAMATTEQQSLSQAGEFGDLLSTVDEIFSRMGREEAPPTAPSEGAGVISDLQLADVTGSDPTESVVLKVTDDIESSRERYGVANQGDRDEKYDDVVRKDLEAVINLQYNGVESGRAQSELIDNEAYVNEKVSSSSASTDRFIQNVQSLSINEVSSEQGNGNITDTFNEQSTEVPGEQGSEANTEFLKEQSNDVVRYF